MEWERCGFGLVFRDGRFVKLSYDEGVEDKRTFDSDEEFRGYLREIHRTSGDFSKNFRKIFRRLGLDI